LNDSRPQEHTGDERKKRKERNTFVSPFLPSSSLIFLGCSVTVKAVDGN
jgi:hypothetical protein